MIPHPDSDEPLSILITRWTPRRKAALIKALKSKEISLDEAQHRFGLSPEEFRSWVTSFESYGIPGLRATRYRIYRDHP
jgi:transposase-like protein